MRAMFVYITRPIFASVHCVDSLWTTYNMRSCILIFLFLHAASATIDLQKLSEKVHTEIMSLKDTASANIQEIKDNIDLDKLKQLDVLGILPIIETKGKLIQLKHKAKQNKIRLYVNTVKGLKSKVFSTLSWPEMRRMDLY